MDPRDETSGLSAALSAPLSSEASAPSAQAENGDVTHPPRPLPARSFHQNHGPSAETEPPRAVPAEAPAEATSSDPLSPDAAFSAIAVEASARSLSAVEAAATDVRNEIKPHKPLEISDLELPTPARSENRDLGQTVPRRMLEPHFEVASPERAFDAASFDPSLRAAADPAEAKSEAMPRHRFGAILKRVAKVFAWLVIGWLALVLALIVAYRFVDPPASMLMLQRWVTGQPVVYEWVPLANISPNVVRAVLLSEDGRFCQHSGVDLEAIEDAIENSDGRSRGGSTISMQVVKNLFLWPSKSYIRKAVELPLTYITELVWPKRRIMEIYLNIAEWGPGIFGIGAAAEYHFHKTAGSLSVRDAARLAVSLPNPLARNAGRPRPGLQRLANAIQVRMRLAPSSQLSCVVSKRPY